jgi:4-amino-4-deoxy-L-arabinose transferase-like glycosyltransferase
VHSAVPTRIGPLDGANAGTRTLAATPVWATWRFALAVILFATAARIVYNIWLSPWDLVGDEAYYWQQSRHLDWCYNEKGPLLAWLIALACRTFGDTEWAVRLPVTLAWGLAAWGLGRLAIAASRGDQRVGALSAILFLLIPAFHANAQICTQDGLMVVLWIALTAAGLWLFRRWRDGQGQWGPWLVIYSLLGVGMLLKQSVLTFLPGLALFWWFHRRTLPLRPVFFAQQAAGFVLVALACIPMLYWNAGHGWPLLAHTLGHLGAGGDQIGTVNKGNPLTWEASTLGALIAFFGPALAVMIWASIRAWRDQDVSQTRFDRRWLICAAWFSTVFYAALALTKPVVATWPLPSMAPLVILVAQVVTPVLCENAPGPHLRRLWRSSVIYGIVAGVAIAFPTAALLIPGVSRVASKRMMGRFGGARQQAAALAQVIDGLSTPDGRPPLVLAPNYGLACLTSFYLPGHPPVATRDKEITNRHSTLEHWPETDISNAMHHGRTLILVQDHRNDPDWASVLFVDSVEPSSNPDYLIATNFQGFRPHEGSTPSSSKGGAR